MDQSDLQKLAHQFVKAIKVKPGNNIWVNLRGGSDEARPFAEACMQAVRDAGGSVYLQNNNSVAMTAFYAAATPEGIAEAGRQALEKMKTMQGYLGIADVADTLLIKATSEQKAAYAAAMRPMVDYRVKNMPWLVLSAPTSDFAQKCGMSLTDFEGFYKDACLVDYDRMAVAAQPLQALMKATDRVRLVGRDTDLSFSIKDIGAVSCTGSHNIPDGEVFSAPVKNSVNGRIAFSRTVYEGEAFEAVSLRFENGKIIDATAENPERTGVLNGILDRDEGARYVGEFAIGFHPAIMHPVGDILFDEKIAGSLHFTPGECYEDADNGNKSSIHWDLVHIQRPEYGGGEIWFDDRLIRKDGLFVLPELQALNPQSLKAPQP